MGTDVTDRHVVELPGDKQPFDGGIAGLTTFTITGWLKSHDGTEGAGGNRILNYCSGSGKPTLSAACRTPHRRTAAAPHRRRHHPLPPLVAAAPPPPGGGGGGGGSPTSPGELKTGHHRLLLQVGSTSCGTPPAVAA
jgi:hypothetical protein